MPHEPPQPSEPQVLPVHAGAHAATHWPLTQLSLVAQVPQTPPQPLEPQTLPLQAGTQVVTQAPSGVQFALAAQVPHTPPHPSAPQTLPVQTGTQVLPFALQTPSAGSQVWFSAQVTPLHLRFAPSAGIESVAVVPEMPSKAVAVTWQGAEASGSEMCGVNRL